MSNVAEQLQLTDPSNTAASVSRLIADALSHTEWPEPDPKAEQRLAKIRAVGTKVKDWVTAPLDVEQLNNMLKQTANWSQPEGGASNRFEGIAQAFGMTIPGRGGFGAPPFSKVMEGGKPKRVYHGTSAVFEEMDPKMAGKGAGGDLYGPSAGGYWTESPKVAGGYSQLSGFKEELDVFNQAI